jgi:hypothetical protein
LAKYIDDIDVRCKSCAKLMATITVRSDVQQYQDKIVWYNKNLIRCPDCAKKG